MNTLWAAWDLGSTGALMKTIAKSSQIGASNTAGARLRTTLRRLQLGALNYTMPCRTRIG